MQIDIESIGGNAMEKIFIKNMPIARKIGNQKLIDELNDLSLKYS